MREDDDFAAINARIEKFNAEMERANKRALRVRMPATLVFALGMGFVFNRLVEHDDMFGLVVGVIALLANGASQWGLPTREDRTP